MTQEQKDLLIKDLCCRIPYGVKVQTDYLDAKTLEGIQFPDYIGISDGYYSLDYMECKPYLFPLSSMTEKQKKELQSLMVHDSYGILYHTHESFDYLCKNNIDFRGLIPMDLALDATNLNIY